MSNETDLDWLARNVHVWPVAATQKVSIGWNGHEDGEPHFVRVDVGGKITKAQWLSLRAELQNKPGWNESPEWAQFLIQTMAGRWLWLSRKPKGMDLEGVMYFNSDAKSEKSKNGTVLGDWRDTLEKRPEEVKPFTSIEDNQEREMKQDNGWFDRGELPPVGVICEAYINHPEQWVETEIVSHKDGFAIGWCKSVMSGCHGDKISEFRPIRTERELAIEEMVDVICDNGFLSKTGTESWRIAERLYDSHFRKEQK